jgi:membrane-associated protein
MTINTNITQVFETLSYTGLFFWLVIYNLLFFVPLPPEEIILLTVGYIASLGHINPFMAGILVALTSLISDNVIFLLTSSGNKLVKKIIHKFGERIFLRYKIKMEKNLPKTLITLAFIPKVRFFGPIISGSLNIKWKKFLIYDSLANAIYCTTYISLGYLFHNAIARLVKELKVWEHVIFYIIMVIISLIVIFLIRRYFIGKKVI